MAQSPRARPVKKIPPHGEEITEAPKPRGIVAFDKTLVIMEEIHSVFLQHELTDDEISSLWLKMERIFS